MVRIHQGAFPVGSEHPGLRDPKDVRCLRHRLSLDLRFQLPIATRDDDLAEAAWAAGVGVVSG